MLPTPDLETHQVVVGRRRRLLLPTRRRTTRREPLCCLPSPKLERRAARDTSIERAMVGETGEVGSGDGPDADADEQHPQPQDEQVSNKTLRRRAKKAAALARRRERFERLGGPPETTFVGREFGIID